MTLLQDLAGDDTATASLPCSRGCPGQSVGTSTSTSPGPKREARRASLLAACMASVLAFAGCAVGPDYARPVLDVPASYKEGGAWKMAEPQAPGSGLSWWQGYRDPVLDALLLDAERANQSIRIAEAQYRQARAIADAARGGLYPAVGVNAGVQRGRTTANGPRLATIDSLGLSASWQPDFWGGVRRGIESGEASAEASSDDLAAAHLSIQTALVQNYVQLRATDTLRDLYVYTADAYARALKLAQAQRAAGVALPSDVALAQSQLATAQAAGVDLEATRSQLEHAIAILTGRSPSAFTLARVDAAIRPYELLALPTPVGMPSQLLERRPDIAAAERRMAAANANIGVARAAFYPTINLSASSGFGASALGSLFDTPSRVWSLGSTLAQTLFDGGLRQARNAQALAAYDATVAQYRQTVLVAFQQVEDNLSALDVLEREAVFQQQAVLSAQTAERLALNQYRGGTATYLSVVTAQTASLTAQRTAVQLRARQVAASVSLVSATGGGWSGAATVGSAGNAPAAAAPDTGTGTADTNDSKTSKPNT